MDSYVCKWLHTFYGDHTWKKGSLWIKVVQIGMITWISNGQYGRKKAKLLDNKRIEESHTPFAPRVTHSKPRK